MTYYRRLPLQALHNARDLGGYPVPGGATRFGVFLRTAVPADLPASDVEFLIKYGLTTVVDFRGDNELERSPSTLAEVDAIRYIRRPTFNAQVAFAARNAYANPKKPAMDAFVRWGEKYVEMIDDCREWVRDALTALAESDGCTLYNCTTGKDRTGIISAMLLGLVGCADEDIIADYCVSEVHLQEVYRPMLMAYNQRFTEERAAEINSPFFKTEPMSMAQLLLHLADKYGGVTAYVRACGVGEDAIAKICSKLIG